MMVCCQLGCKGAKKSVDKSNDKEGIESLSLKETQEILQLGLSTNHINAFFTNEERNIGISILITDFIKPFYKDIKLEKFGKKAKFQTKQEIYNKLDEKFINILLGYKEENEIMLLYMMSFRSYAMEVKFIKHDDKWVKITKDFSTEIKPRAIYNYRDKKIKCLAYSILLKKYPEKYDSERFSYMRSCSKYD
jgi:hypothetical protein